MSKRISAFAVHILAITVCNAGMILNSGESFEFTFAPSDFEYQYSIPAPRFHYDHTAVFSSVPFNTSIQVSLYDSSLSLLYSYTQNIAPGIGGDETAHIYHTFSRDQETGQPINVWPNMAGTIKIESINNSFVIDSIAAGAFIGNDYYAASIPEPSTVLLFGIGGFSTWFLRRNKHYHEN